jgi:hypothetical protein
LSVIFYHLHVFFLQREYRWNNKCIWTTTSLLAQIILFKNRWVKCCVRFSSPLTLDKICLYANLSNIEQLSRVRMEVFQSQLQRSEWIRLLTDWYACTMSVISGNAPSWQYCTCRFYLCGDSQGFFKLLDSIAPGLDITW